MSRTWGLFYGALAVISLVLLASSMSGAEATLTAAKLPRRNWPGGLKGLLDSAGSGDKRPYGPSISRTTVSTSMRREGR